LLVDLRRVLKLPLGRWINHNVLVIKRLLSIKCPYCGSSGKVSRMHNKVDLCMRCPACKERWYSRSGICPECEKPNGYTGNGLCIKCYTERKQK
jgi:hypothetical protein